MFKVRKIYFKMDWNEDTPFLVVVNSTSKDISWTEKLKFPYIINYNDDTENKSEINILAFIVNHYDKLPENIINVNGYENKFYHNGSLVDILNDTEFENKYKKSKTKGYWNFNTQIMGSVVSNQGRMLQSGWWGECMEKYFGSIYECGDFSNGKNAYSQFVVSRNRIHSLPKDFYDNMYNWIINNVLQENIEIDPITLCPKYNSNMIHPNSSHYMYRYLEWSWELIFTQWKQTENINITLPDGRNIFILYGAGKYFRDVTDIFMNNCFDKNTCRITIPSTFNFNENFGDPLYGCIKTLRIIIDGKITEITETKNITFF
jgi:hypothetical protein